MSKASMIIWWTLATIYSRRALLLYPSFPPNSPLHHLPYNSVSERSHNAHLRVMQFAFFICLHRLLHFPYHSYLRVIALTQSMWGSCSYVHVIILLLFHPQGIHWIQIYFHLTTPVFFSIFPMGEYLIILLFLAFSSFPWAQDKALCNIPYFWIRKIAVI